MVEVSKKATKPQIAWIDNARIIACFFAVFLHTSATVINLSAIGSVDWWMGNLMNSLSRWSMPVFVMISGALLLDPSRNEPITVFYKKRASRILLPLVAWTLFYLAFQYFGKLATTGEQTPVLNMVGSVVYGLPYYHLWYLYMIIGLYLFAPFLARIIKNSSQKEQLILCGAFFGFSMLGNAFITYSISAQIPAFFTFIYYLPYFFAGYIISKIDYQPPAWALWTIFAVSGILNGICYYLTLGPDGASNGYFFNTLCITIVPMSISSIFLIRKIKIPCLSRNLGSKLALFGLGIYLIHPFFLDIFKYLGVTPLVFIPVLAAPILATLVFAVSLGVIALVSKVPWLNKAIGIR